MRIGIRLWLYFFLSVIFMHFHHFINADEVFQKDISTTIENNQEKPLGFSSASKQLRIITDAFDNKIAAWINDGVIYASTKIAGIEWQSIPDIVSSSNEIISDFDIGTDSLGNAFVIWQSLPNQSIQVATKTQTGDWQTQIIAHLETQASNLQIAAGLTGYATAAWKVDHQANAQLQFRDIPLPSSHETEALDDLFFLTSHFLTSAFSEHVSYSFNEDCPDLPSSLPFPPKHVRGHQVANQFATQTDLVNIITWKAANKGPKAVAYYIYSDSSLDHLATIIPAHHELKFKDHNRKENHTYSYFIVAVDASGIQSPPIEITFKGSKTHITHHPLPVSIAITPTNPTIEIGDKIQFTAIVKFSNGSKKELTNLIWRSSDLTVATINSNGLATTVNTGTTIISAVFKGLAACTTLTVTCPSITITTNSLPAGLIDSEYSQTIQTTGGIAPLTFSIVSGSLPTGLILDTNTGTISGTPISIGTFNFTIRAISNCGSFSDQDLSITIIIPCPPITITTTSLPDGQINTAYSQTIQTTGGVAPITFSITNGNLPSGLTLNASTGTISGTPTSTGKSNFTIRATSSCGSFSDRSLSITITCPPITITTTSLPDGQVNSAYSQTIQTTGGIAPITFSITNGNLPSGLTLNANTGTISGTPTSKGTSNFTILATSSCGSFSDQSLSITITCPPITFSPISLPNAQQNVSYNQTINITSSNVSITNVTVQILQASPGLSATAGTSNVSVTGTPTTRTDFVFRVIANNPCSQDSQTYRIRINP